MGREPATELDAGDVLEDVDAPAPPEDPEGVPASELEVRDGVWLDAEGRPYDGRAYELHDNGNVAWHAELRDGRWHGEFRRWFEDGRPNRLLHYVEGEQEGPQMVWRRNGTPKWRRTVRDGRDHGRVVRWYENGNRRFEGDYVDGLRHGVVTTWYENGQKESEIRYERGEREGPWIQWYDNGQKESAGALRDGKKVGVWRRWSRDGELDYERDFGEG